MSYRTLYCRPTPLRAAVREAREHGALTADEASEMLAALRGLTRAEFVTTASEYAEFARVPGSALVMELAHYRLSGDSVNEDTFDGLWRRIDYRAATLAGGRPDDRAREL